MENPRAIVHAVTQLEVALMMEETGLLEELPYECPSPSDHNSDDQFTTCSVSITYSYEGTAIIDPSKKKDDFPPTATEEGSPVVETEGQVTQPSPSIVPLTDVLGPVEKSKSLQKDNHRTTESSPKVNPYGDMHGLEGS